MKELTKDKLILLDTLYYTDDSPSLLIKSVKTNNNELAKMLIKYNIRINVKDDKHNDALFYAIDNNNIDIVKLLCNMENVNEVFFYKKHSPLTYACKKNNIEIVKYLLLCGADKNHKTDSKSDAVIYASIYSDVEILELLIDEYTKYEKNIYGNDALLYGCLYNRYDTVKYILENGGNINISNNDSETPLSICCKFGYKEIATYLFTSGHKIDYKLNLLLNMRTVKELSERYKWKELIDLFIKK